MSDPHKGQWDNQENDDSFEKFFRPSQPQHFDQDATDPGVPSAAVAAQPTTAASTGPGAQYYQQPSQGSGYVEPQNEPPRRSSAAVPLIILFASLAVIALIAALILGNRGESTKDANNTAPLTTQSQTTGSSSEPTESSPSESSSSSSSTSSSSSSSSKPVTLPAGSSTACNNPGFSTSSGVTCAFAQDVYNQANGLAVGESGSYSVISAATGKHYSFSCMHQRGSYITCTGISQPDDGRRPTVYIVPQN